ncbi:MAG TPA: PAS domain S-box protein [Bdellovibrionota bacterium]|nr:PAS domain S-box protein [Bdellovibrionota bacterium]
MAEQAKEQSASFAAQGIETAKLFCNAIVEEAPGVQAPIDGAGLWIVDREMRVLWMNDTMERIYGTQSEIRGKPCYFGFRGLTEKCADCLPSKAFETGNIITGYISRTIKDGSERFYQLVEAPLFDDNNEISRVLEIVLDITEKARLEESLRDSEQEYRALFENAATAVMMTGEDGIIRKVNPQFEELSGFRKCDLEGRVHYLKFIHPIDREMVSTYHRLRHQNTPSVPTTYEFQFLNRWDDVRRVQISIKMIANTGFQIASMIDITDKWKLEQAIREKDQFLANILRHSVETIVAMDPSGTIRTWNRGAELMFGYRSREIVGRRFVTLIAPEFRRGQKYAQLTKKFQEQGFLRDALVEAVTKEGRKLTINISRTAIRDESGKDVGSSAVIRDVTETKRLEQRMIQQEKMLALGELAASLAHEVKNPLNSMVINMEVLKGHLNDLPEQKRALLDRYFNVVTAEVERVNKVMRGVLDFARPIESQFSRVDIPSVLSHVLALVQAQAEREKIQLKIDLEKNLPAVDGARDHLTQVFLNLFLNAFQAMPKGGAIAVRAEREGQNHVAVSVRDTGIGIPKPNLKRIFDLYFSTKEKGSGLGLPLVKRLITAHGGKIRVKSKVNHGSSFTVTLPIP